MEVFRRVESGGRWVCVRVERYVGSVELHHRGAGQGDRRDLAVLLADRGVSVLAAEGELERLPDVLRAAGAAAQVTLVNIDPRPHDALGQVGPWVREFSGTAFFLMSRLVDAGLLME